MWSKKLDIRHLLPTSVEGILRDEKRVLGLCFSQDTEEEDLDGLYSLLSDENEQVINNYRPDDNVSSNQQYSSASQAGNNVQDYQVNGQWSPSMSEDARVLEFSSIGTSLGSSECESFGDFGSGLGIAGDSLGVGFGGTEVLENDLDKRE